MNLPESITSQTAIRLDAVNRLRLRFCTPIKMAAILDLSVDSVDYCLAILRQRDRERGSRLAETQDEMRVTLEQFHLNEVNDCLAKADSTESETTWSAAKRLASDNAERVARLRGLQQQKLDVSGSLTIAKILGQLDAAMQDDDQPPPIV